MLGSVLICPRKDENAVKLLCNRLLDACPGLEENIKVLGTDGENRKLIKHVKLFRMQCY